VGVGLYATEENVTTDCKSAGRFPTYDLPFSKTFAYLCPVHP
jgi:hypothetical protein